MGYVWNWKLYTEEEDEAGSEPLGERVVTGYWLALNSNGMCILTTSTTVLAFASVSTQWVLAAVVLFSWMGKISQTPSKMPFFKGRDCHIS